LEVDSGDSSEHVYHQVWAVHKTDVNMNSSCLDWLQQKSC